MSARVRSMSIFHWVILYYIGACATCAYTAAQIHTRGSCPPERRDVPLESIQTASVPQAASSPAAEPSSETLSTIDQVRRWIEDRRFEEADRKLRELLSKPAGRCFDALILSAQIRKRIGQSDEAIAATEEALTLQPRSIEARMLLASLFTDSMQPDAALGQLRAAAQLGEEQLGNPLATLAWFLLGDLLANSGYCTAAVSAYEHFDDTIWDTSPEHANAPAISLILSREPRGAFERRLQLLMQLGEPARCARLTRFAVQRWPDDIQVARRHASALLFAARATEAFDFARSWLDSPNGGISFLPEAVRAAQAAQCLDTWVTKQMQLVREGTAPAYTQELPGELLNADATLADRLGTLLLERPEPHDDLAWNVACARLRSGGTQQAIDALVKWVAENPDRPPGGRKYEQWCAAVAACADFENQSRQIAIQQSGDYAVQYVLGFTAAGLEKAELADAYFAAALAARPDFTAAEAARGNLLLAKYEWEKARLLAEAMLKSNQNLAAGWFLLGQAADGLDEIAKAEEAFKKAIKHGPDEPPHKIAYAQHCRRIGDRISAQRYFADALVNDPRNPEAHEGLIETYVQDNKLAMVREHFEKMQSLNLPADTMRRVSSTVRHIGDMWSAAHLEDLRAQLEADPRDVTTAKILAAANLQLGDSDEARRIAIAALTVAPRDYQLLFLVGNLHASAADFDKAVEVYETLARRHPNRNAVLGRLAACYQADFRFDRSEQILRRLATQVGDGWNGYHVELLIQLDRLGRFDEALNLLDEGLATRGGDEDLLRRKAMVLFAANRKNDAAKIVESLLEKHVQYSPQSDSLLRFASAMEAHGAAEKATRKWLESAAPGSPERWFTLGALVRVLCDAKRGDEALKLLRELTPGNAREAFQRRIWMGDAHNGADRPDKAIAEYEALLNEPFGGLDERLGLQSKIVETLRDSEQFERALEACELYLKQAAERQPEAEAIFAGLQGDIFQAAGREREYLQILERAYRNNPNQPGLANDLAYSWIEAGRNFEQALKMSRSAVAADPLNAAFLDTRAWAYYKLGQFELAHKQQTRAVQLRNGHDADQFDHLGDICWRMDRREEAAAAWKNALEFLEKETERERRRPGRSALRNQLNSKLNAAERGDPVNTAATAAESSGGK